jgi:hypothetical protein
MKIRGDINAVSVGPDGGHALLAAFLEATGKIDRRALQKRATLDDAPIAINLEAFPALREAQAALLDADPELVEANLTARKASPAVLEVPTLLEETPTSLPASPALLEATTTTPKSRLAPFAFRRANLVRA